ncbi:MAG: HEAT repeat domain-containing protein [Myxococcota bacterium]|nr:HEAT repeat domain-containing protein [Myxococcota bacterium]
MRKRGYWKRAVRIWILCALWLTPNAVRADARLDYLIGMLENGGNYRIRVQAATTLGKLRSKKAVPALTRALSAENELVVISAAIALGQIGDVSVIPELEQAHASIGSQAAKSQVAAALRILRALSPTPYNNPSAVDATPRFLVRIDAMGDSSGSGAKDNADLLRKIVTDRITQEPGVVLQSKDFTAAQVTKKLKREKLTGYILSGSLIRLNKVDHQIFVKVGLNVFTNPGYSLLMMPTVDGKVAIASSAKASRESRRAAEERAMRAVTDELVRSIFDKLRQMDPP